MQRGIIVILLTFLITLLGCVAQKQIKCKPMLLPCKEFSYKTEPKKLGNNFNLSDAGQTIELFNLKVNLPRGWRFEKMHEKTYKFTSDDGRIFLFSLNSYAPFSYSTENLSFIGCNNFETSHGLKTKTHKEFYSELYLFTDDQLSEDPDFWQYFILWSKAGILRDSVALFHYTGDHLEAFQRNIDPIRMRGNLKTHIDVFPNMIEPNYITIASLFIDDPFFTSFLNMLDTLNP